jgi:hypothetical protein
MTTEPTRLFWPAKLVGGTHRLSFQFTESPPPPTQREIEAAVAGHVPGAVLTWEWLGRVVDVRIEAKASDALLQGLDGMVREIAQRVPTSDVRYVGRRPPSGKPRSPPAPLPKVELIEVDRKAIPAGAPLWWEPQVLPAGLSAETPMAARRAADGVWLTIDWIRDGARLSAIPEQRPAERRELVLPRAVRKQELVLSRDGLRALVANPMTIVEVAVPSLARLREIPVPRTPRDNNRWTSVAYHADGQRLLVGTETGLHLLAYDGEPQAFCRCLDILELVTTDDARLALVAQNDPRRGELFAIRDGAIKSIAKFKPMGEPFARGDRLFSTMSPRRAAEVIGANEAWHAVFGQE